MVKLPKYCFSPYHKDTLFLGVPPAKRSKQASICPRDIDNNEALKLLQEGYNNELYKTKEGVTWPKKIYAYCKVRKQWFASVLSNQETAEYHGYPVEFEEVPKEISKRI